MEQNCASRLQTYFFASSIFHSFNLPEVPEDAESLLELLFPMVHGRHAFVPDVAVPEILSHDMMMTGGFSCLLAEKHQGTRSIAGRDDG
jgi:hypothetical protein